MIFGVGVCVTRGVFVGVTLGVALCLGVGVIFGVRVGVGEGAKDTVGVGVGFKVGVGLGVRIGLGVGVEGMETIDTVDEEVENEIALFSPSAISEPEPTSNVAEPFAPAFTLKLN